MYGNNLLPEPNIICSKTSTAMMMAVVILAAAAMVVAPNHAFATTPTTGGTGFQEAAFQIYSLLDGAVGTLVAIISVGAGLAVSTIRGFSAPVAIGSGGVALAAALGPDIAVTLSGGAIIL